VSLRRRPEEVWDVISDTAGQPRWAIGVTKAERDPDKNGHEAWRLSMGRNAFVLETVASEPPVRLVKEIADVNGPFSGSWEYRIVPEDGGARVELTERGRIKNAVARGVLRYLMGESAYARKHLAGLAKHLGESARVT
jgi:uncharacterized protein YndB with AHSA1/START domain